ncbi:hypothetical protein K466DRAFT_592976 [Polyporus arcularius HHB13444]|uniref:Uncharacterized protein n=1 Tax=Polyporus arcularius HHB13444 TaxID=1314778 RepID=A0A5C3NMG4_9APHY|nr:hypothetical protein K466DRAFT_592976 [Polyporus arcularius HHB13444]
MPPRRPSLYISADLDAFPVPSVPSQPAVWERIAGAAAPAVLSWNVRVAREFLETPRAQCISS